MTELERFMKGLDLHKPDWWITLADEQDKNEYMRLTSPAPGTIGYDAKAIERQRERVRNATGRRLTFVVRAAIEAGLVQAR